MAYAPRLFQPDGIYFITSRTIDGTLFLRPSPQVNNAIGSVLADAQERYEVELFDFIFLSNHMHLAARSTGGHLPEFMQYLKANIAVAVNRIVDRNGHLWERRYAASPILDEGAQVERAGYIYAHGVKEGLVDRAEHWPGVASVKERLSGVTPSYQRFDQTGFTRARFGQSEAPNADNFRRTVTTRLSPWPVFAELSAQAMKVQVQELARQGRGPRHDKRRKKRPIGVKAVLAQDPWSRPKKKLQRTPNPLCHAATRQRRIEYIQGYSAFLDSYARASLRYRSGESGVCFPLNSFPPRLPNDWAMTPRAGPTATAARPN